MTRELESVQAELDRLDEQLQERGEYGFGKGDPAVYQWELNLAMKQRFLEHREQIQNALQRLETGDYGLCTSCRSPIEAERLEALPFTSLCITCARRRR
ncbi:MAG: TraR/DksA family transcriptional regulator [Anaerolineae bacterium]